MIKTTMECLVLDSADFERLFEIYATEISEIVTFLEAEYGECNTIGAFDVLNYSRSGDRVLLSNSISWPEQLGSGPESPSDICEQHNIPYRLLPALWDPEDRLLAQHPNCMSDEPFAIITRKNIRIHTPGDMI